MKLVKIVAFTVGVLCASHAWAGDECLTLDQAKQTMLDSGLTPDSVNAIKKMSDGDFKKFVDWVNSVGDMPEDTVAAYYTKLDDGGYLVVGFDANGCMTKAGRVDPDDWTSIFG